MEKFLRKPIQVPFESLYLDPNNPRLRADEPPGYDNPKKLFDSGLQAELEATIEDVYNVADLQVAIESQGWMPIDNILVWTYPKYEDRHIVLEGNTRTVALRRIRARLPREREKLGKMKEGRKRYAPHDLTEQEELVGQLERVVADTATLTVVPLEADSIEELNQKLPRVLAVRHIIGVKGWGNYAEDLWLLTRYEDLFERERPGDKMEWDKGIIERVAHEASLGYTKARRQLQAASCYSHFKVKFEDELPEGDEFDADDYYLFENIVKKPWLRTQFELTEAGLSIPAERERTLFDWIFKLPRGRTADDNPNIFYRHENVLVWEQMQRYDQQHHTAFAARFNVEEPDSAPRMREVEAEYLAHKASRKPSDIIDGLLRALNGLDAGTMVSEGSFLKAQLKSLQGHTAKILKMIESVA
jgi:hypothetical protein